MSRKKKAKHHHLNYYQTSHIELIPRTLTQRLYTTTLLNHKNTIIFATGPAGSGKTMMACLAALKELRDGNVKKIVLTRPVVEVDEQLGYLPGTIDEKMEPWTKPIFDVFENYYTKQELMRMLDNGTIEISPLAYMRGRSFHNTFIICDEMQSATINQMKMVLTRIAEGSRMVLTGDVEQTDRQGNGLTDFLLKLDNIGELPDIKVIKFQREDIQRHPIVAKVLAIYGE